MLILGLALAALIGLSLGLLGSGGSIITLPVLVYVARVPVQLAVGMSLVIVGGTSALGTLLKLRYGSLDWRAATFFSVSGMGGAYFGAKFTHLVSAPMLMFLFGVLMVVVGIRLFQNRDVKPAVSQCRAVRCLAVGLAVGLLTGFLGVGGGFLILPALVLFAGLEMKQAVGTSLAIITINCAGGLAGQPRGANFDWELTLGFLLVAMVGTIAGSLLAKKLSADILRRGFAWCVLILGLLLAAWNLAAALR